MSIKIVMRFTGALLVAVVVFHVGMLNAGPHVHGEAELTIAMENTRLQIQLLAPVGDIVGFEHQPTTPEELKSMAGAKEALSLVAQLFVISGARCELSEVTIDVKDLVDAKHVTHAHNNITANYDYECQSLDEISKIEVNAFDLFPALLRINSMWINERSQGSQVLSKKARQIHINQPN
ncbi:MAG: hypothetical protein ACI82S_002163 [Patiriisocius sp.]|jgi:hypothetical protein